jgi:hydrophobe/amphiphile efflux-1 (HAE1) family protein
MASLSTISIRRPVLAIVMSLIIIIFGAISFTFLGVREYPSIDPPVITVKTNYTGANAEVIQSQITEPLEKALNGIEGVRTISSASNMGSSTITVEFNLNANLEAAANDVRDKVGQAVRQLPQDIDGLPVVTKADANSDAILAITLQSDTKNQLQVSDYAENVVAERLQTIPGVSTIQIWGHKRYAMRIWMQPAKMASYGITSTDIEAALSRENVELPGGKIEGNRTELSVRTVGKLTDEESFNNLIIKSQGDNIVRLKDIGYARLGPENEETILKESGIPMIGLGLIPQPGANYLDIAEEFYKRVELIKKDLPKDYKLKIALDNTKFIKLSIEEVEETLIIAIVLVILIIYLFFRDWLVAFRPLIDIPVSLIGAFFIMYIMGYSINVLTLLAIVLATGLVVDDGIVVTENIFKKIEKGKNPTDAAIEGSNEIFFAVIATSITLAAVFMPVIFLEGFTGRLFREFGVVIAGSVLISAFVSLTLTPMLNAKLVKKDPTKKSWFYNKTEPFFQAMISGYENSLTGFLKKRWIAIPIILIAMGVIVGINMLLPKELAPMDDRSAMRLSVTAPEGASFEYTDQFMDKVADFVMDSIPEKEIILCVTAPGFSGSGAVNTGFARIVLSDPSDRKRSQMEIANFIAKNAKEFPEAKIFVTQQQTISSSGRSGLPVQFVIQAPDFERLKDKLPKFLEEANKNPVFQGVDVNLKFNKPELYISINREKAKSVGVSVADIAQVIQLSLSGQRFGYFNMAGKQYQVVGQVDRANRDEPLDLKSMYVRNNTGELIQIDNLVTVEEQSSPPQLYHYNRYQSATVSAGLAPGKTIGEGIDAMNEIMQKVLPILCSPSYWRWCLYF